MITTKVGTHNVEVKDSHIPSLVWFDAGVHGRGHGERGWFAFWTAEVNHSKWKTWGRALVTLPPGDRLDRMKREMKDAPDKCSRDHYAAIWKKGFKCGAGIKLIRPSTTREIGEWCASHGSDAKFIKWICVGGKFVTFVSTQFPTRAKPKRKK